MAFLPRHGLQAEAAQAVGFGEGVADFVEVFFGGGGRGVAVEGEQEAVLRGVVVRPRHVVGQHLRGAEAFVQAFDHGMPVGGGQLGHGSKVGFFRALFLRTVFFRVFLLLRGLCGGQFVEGNVFVALPCGGCGGQDGVFCCEAV